ncbi:MAG: hypothetical protein JEY71_15925 [Sphaerochaeta sp.]|nr:hypothetical protein [Sphaerochaeta sp.]
MEPDLPGKKGEILLETIVSILFSVLSFFLYLKPDLLAIYQRGTEPTPMLVSSSAKGLLFGFLLLSLLASLISLVKLIGKRWGTPLVWFSCSIDLSCIFGIL